MPNGNRLPLFLPKRAAPPSCEQRLLDTRAAAQYLAVSEKTLSRITAPAGDLPAVRLGARTVRYDRRDLDDYIARHKQGPIAPDFAAPMT